MPQPGFSPLSHLDRLEGSDFNQGIREVSHDKVTLEAAGGDPKAEETAKKQCERVWLGLEETLSVHLAQIEPVEGRKRC